MGAIRKIRLTKFLVSVVWRKLELPVAEIFIHLIVTILTILSIAAIELVLQFVGLAGKKVPGTSISLSDWMLCLEVVTATLIILIGIGKALIALVRS